MLIGARRVGQDSVILTMNEEAAIQLRNIIATAINWKQSGHEKFLKRLDESLIAADVNWHMDKRTYQQDAYREVVFAESMERMVDGQKKWMYADAMEGLDTDSERYHELKDALDEIQEREWRRTGGGPIALNDESAETDAMWKVIEEAAAANDDTDYESPYMGE